MKMSRIKQLDDLMEDFKLSLQRFNGQIYIWRIYEQLKRDLRELIMEVEDEKD
jgi:hypothetical protein